MLVEMEEYLQINRPLPWLRSNFTFFGFKSGITSDHNKMGLDKALEKG